MYAGHIKTLHSMQLFVLMSAHRKLCRGEGGKHSMQSRDPETGVSAEWSEI